ncbi:MAG: hypothetical protein V1865_03260 [bacterium]
MEHFEKEKIIVKKFFNNQGIDCDNFVFYKGEQEPCDVYCKTLNKQFQITHSDQEFIKRILTEKFLKQLRTLDDAIDNIIINPVFKKIKAYGKSAQNIILLVDYKKEWSPILNKYVAIAKNKIKTSPQNFFANIYLVCADKNIKLF